MKAFLIWSGIFAFFCFLNALAAFAIVIPTTVTPSAVISGKTGNSVNFGTYTPTNVEMNVSTCAVVILNGATVVGFYNYSDFLNCLTDKNALEVKIAQMKQWLTNLSDMPTSQDYIALKEQYGWMLSYYNSLP